MIISTSSYNRISISHPQVSQTEVEVSLWIIYHTRRESNRQISMKMNIFFLRIQGGKL